VSLCVQYGSMSGYAASDETCEPLLEEARSHACPEQPVNRGDAETAGAKNRPKRSGYFQLRQLLSVFKELLVEFVRRFFMYIVVSLIVIVAAFIFVGASLGVPLLVLCLPAIAYNLSDLCVYAPDQPYGSRHHVRLPSAVGLPYESLRLHAADGTRLHAYFCGQSDHSVRCNAVTLLYLHGNAGNIGDRLPNVKAMHKHLKANILILEYRGYGLSQGRPSEHGLYSDAAAALKYLHTRSDIDRSRIVVFGRSLGGAICTHLACEAWTAGLIRAVVLENTFTSLPDFAGALFGPRSLVARLPLWCYKNKLLTRHKLVRLRPPCLVVVGARDTLVPPAMGGALYRACGAPLKRLARFSDGDHNYTARCPGYWLVLKWFLLEVCSPPSTPLQPPTFPPNVTWLTDSCEVL